MFCLPAIDQMNATAKKSKKKLFRAVSTHKLDGKVIRCEHCDKKATRVDLYYDIFSDDPKGVIATCDEHEGYTDESYFMCECGCNKMFANNYTWEIYYIDTPQGRMSLNHYADIYLADPKNWITLTDKNIAEAVKFENLRKAPHLIGVRMPCPEAIEFVANSEFDSMDGHCISGSGELEKALHDLKDQGVKRAVIVMDASYQFAVSLAVFKDSKEAK
jgi:hypothetical protein